MTPEEHRIRLGISKKTWESRIRRYGLERAIALGPTMDQAHRSQRVGKQMSKRKSHPWNLSRQRKFNEG